MDSAMIDFSCECGKMKPMHAVNNGPVYKFTSDQRITNLDAFREAGIPYARTHDASFCSTYGGEHTVDVHNIFRNFDADENDPASYDFALTDEYMRVILHANCHPFYRLGSRIEHETKKYGTLPPKDFEKWARVCEHIIRHYTEGWADGFHFKEMEYWEIWNEPDGGADDPDPVNKKCWGGTKEQFFDLFRVTATHLKKCFPQLKIGGPAVCCPNDWTHDFLRYVSEKAIPVDFISWHYYGSAPEQYRDFEKTMHEWLLECGLDKCESILDEWNYVRGWEGEEWEYSLLSERGLKGSSFVAATMAMSQYEPVDMLMYYDARPCGMNGLFKPYEINKNLKGYYALYAFNKLYALGKAVPFSTESPLVYGAAAKDENGNAAFMLTCYDEKEAEKSVDLKISLRNIGSDRPLKLTYYILDDAHDLTPYREEIVTGKHVASYVTLPLFTTYLVTVTPVEESI